MQSHRERILVVVDEVDDFLNSDKLVFNICSNKGNAFNKGTLECYFEVSRAVYRGESCPALPAAKNVAYWQQLHAKFSGIHAEVRVRS